ncbi:MAG: hypothetical protein HS120_09785 [Burkholderiales bacterium]|nr:hypothetical protein [Burkholderiales bacterium]
MPRRPAAFSQRRGISRHCEHHLRHCEPRSGVATQSDGEGGLDCRVGLRPSRNDEVFLGIASTTTVFASRAAAWQPSHKVAKVLGCFVSYASSQRRISSSLQIPLTPSLRTP